MKLLILGGSGRTGKHIVREALQRGHQVNAVIRDGKKIDKAPGLKIFGGSPADADVLEKALENCEAVISALNISRTSDFPWAKLRTPKDLLSKTLSNLIRLAQQNSLKHLLVISAAGVGDSRKDMPGFFRWLIDHSNIGYAYREHENQERLLKTSNLNWTTLRPMGLTNSSKIKKVRVSLGGKPKPKMTIGRKTVAHFILEVVEQHKYIRETPTLSEE